MTVRLRAPESRSARIRFSGIPQSPKPPAMIVIPSRVSPVSSGFASAKTLLPGICLPCWMCRGECRHAVAILPDEREAWVVGRIHAETFRGIHLRHQAAIRHARSITVTELAGEVIVLEMRTERVE